MVRGMKYWKCLREAVKSLFLVILKIQLDTSLSNLIQLILLQ